MAQLGSMPRGVQLAELAAGVDTGADGTAQDSPRRVHPLVADDRRRWLLALSCGGDKPGPAIDPGQLDRGAQVAQRQADKFPLAHRRCGYHRQTARSPIMAPGSWVWVITRFRVITQTQLTCMLAGHPALPATIRQRLAGEPDVY
jgi:hypothetical protein